MRTMFQAGDFFARITDKGGLLKLTIWNSEGVKIVSEFISMPALDDLLNKVEVQTSPELVAAIREKIRG